MNTLSIFNAFTLGGILGAFYFIGLWCTIRQMRSRNPAALFAFSYLLRTVVVIAGFHLIMDDRWELLSTAVVGFIAARAIIIRRTKNGRVG